MATDYRHINRLLEIYTLIQGGQGWTAKRLAEKFKTTERTIFRDIEILRSVDIPVDHDPDKKCYQIRRDFYMPSVELTFDESLALIALGRTIHDQEQIPFSRPALKALAKIRGQLPPIVRQKLDQVEDRMAVKLAASATQEAFQDCYDRVRQALATHTCLRCTYEATSHSAPANGNGQSSEPVPFLLKPYALFFCQRAWYVVGFHGQRGAVRTLKLNRFVDMQPTTQTYHIPKSFTLEKHLGNAWRMIRGNQTHQVELHFDRHFAETITDTIWHATQAYEHQPDGSLKWTCTVDGLDEIVWWILSMGAHCRVLSPQPLIARVREESARMLALYNDASPAPAAGMYGEQKHVGITNI